MGPPMLMKELKPLVIEELKTKWKGNVNGYNAALSRFYALCIQYADTETQKGSMIPGQFTMLSANLARYATETVNRFRDVNNLERNERLFNEIFIDGQ